LHHFGMRGSLVQKIVKRCAPIFLKKNKLQKKKKKKKVFVASLKKVRRPPPLTDY